MAAAAFKISVRSNIRQALRQLDGERAAVEKAAARTINRLATQGRTQFSREIRRTYSVKASDLAKAIRIVKRASGKSLTAIISADGRPISLAHFGPRQTKRGVTFRVLKSGSRKTVRSAFILQKSGGKVVFARGQYSGNRFVFGKSRLPITKLVGPSVPSMFRNRDVTAAVTRFIDQNFEARFAHELRFARGLAG